MKEHFGLIYKVTNLNNGKIYIGLTTQNLYDRKSKHKRNVFINNRQAYFYNAIRKHGWGNFKWEILGYCKSKEELAQSEIECIKFFQSNNRLYGYNSTIGGEGLNEPTEAVREKLRESGRRRTGFKHSEETKKILSEHGKNQIGPNKGKKLSKEWKQQMSVAQKRRYKDPKQRIQLSERQKKLWKDEEYKKRMLVERRERVTEEYREKFRKLNGGGNNPRAIKLKINDTVYDCIKDAATALEIPPPTLYSRIDRYKKKDKFPEGWSLL